MTPTLQRNPDGDDHPTAHAPTGRVGPTGGASPPLPAPRSLSLGGRVVAITGGRAAVAQAQLVRRYGGVPFVAPTVGSLTPEAREGVVAFLDALRARPVQWAIFLTGVGTRALLGAARELGRLDEVLDALARATVVARGYKTVAALRSFGVAVDHEPPEPTAEGVLRLLREHDVAGALVALQLAGEASEPHHALLRTALRAWGAEVIEAPLYHYAPPEDSARVRALIEAVIAGRVDAITFTSPPAVRNLFSAAEAHGRAAALRTAMGDLVVVVAVGPSTTRALEERGVSPHVVPERALMGPMLEALATYWSALPSPARRAARPSGPLLDDRRP